MRERSSVFGLIILLAGAACAGSGTRNSAADSSIESAQSSAGRGEAVLQLEPGRVVIEYGRPALRGRDLEQLVSLGQVWRMGSNAATTLTSDVDLKFGDRLVPKGKYVLRARFAGEGKWELIVQTEDGKPVVDIPLTFQKVDRSADLMTIELIKKGEGGAFVLHWGTLTLSTDFNKA